MRLRAMVWTVALGMFVAGAVASVAQSSLTAQAQSGASPGAVTPPASASATALPANAQPGANTSGGQLHGVVKSGNVPLPGVTLTAQNTLTGKRFSTTTDVTGAWSMTIPQNGRYVIRTQFAAFAMGSKEALLNAASHDQTVNFDLMLASRAAAEEQKQEGQASQVSQVIRQ